MTDTPPFQPDADLTQSRFSALLLRAYAIRWLRRPCLELALRLEGGEFSSATLRAILARYHGVRIGGFSYGSCLVPGRLPAGVTIGRYASIGWGLRVYLRNHPMESVSMHPFFFNHRLGLVDDDTVPFSELWIGHDA